MTTCLVVVKAANHHILIQTIERLNQGEVKEKNAPAKQGENIKNDTKQSEKTKSTDATATAIAKINKPANIKKGTVAKKRNRVNIKNNTTQTLKITQDK